MAVKMSTVQEIENAIQHLPPDELKRLSAWMREYEYTAFDRQIAADAAAGKLDFLIDEAEEDVRQNGIMPLNEFLNER